MQTAYTVSKIGTINIPLNAEAITEAVSQTRTVY
jgi:hypothetical protein